MTFSSINFIIIWLSHQSTFSQIDFLINQLSHQLTSSSINFLISQLSQISILFIFEDFLSCFIKMCFDTSFLIILRGRVFKKVWKKYTLFFEGFTYKVAVQYQVSRSMTKGQGQDTKPSIKIQDGKRPRSMTSEIFSK